MTDDAGPNGTLSDAQVKAHEALVEAWLQAQTQANPERVAAVSKRHQVLTPAQLRYRESREQQLSAIMEQSEALAVDGQGHRLHPPSDS